MAVSGFIISPFLLQITEPFISIEIPYCELNEIKSTNNSFIIEITEKARNLRYLFPLKDKSDYKPFVIC